MKFFWQRARFALLVAALMVHMLILQYRLNRLQQSNLNNLRHIGSLYTNQTVILDFVSRVQTNYLAIESALFSNSAPIVVLHFEDLIPRSPAPQKRANRL